jgi:hypothetical protein
MIYFITAREIGRVKIGYSASPRHRFSKIQSDSPVRLALERICDGDTAEEARLHARFAAHRIAGEWFNLAPDIEAHMATIPALPGKPKSLAQVIIAATGMSKGHVSQMLSDKYSNQLTIPIAISVYRHSGHLIGPLEGASEPEIDVLEKYCGRYRKPAANAFTEARVVVCDVCQHRVDGGVRNACTFVDCPHSARGGLGEAA